MFAFNMFAELKAAKQIAKLCHQQKRAMETGSYIEFLSKREKKESVH